MAKRRSFGKIRKVPRKTFPKGIGHEASFPNPRHGYEGEPRRVVRTFKLATDAKSWLANQEASIYRDEWKSPQQMKVEEDQAKAASKGAKLSFREFAGTWLKKRDGRHKATVKRSYESQFRVHIFPRWGDVPITEITPKDVDDWALIDLSPDRPGARRHAYELFRTVMRSAESLRIIESSPCTSETDENVAESCRNQESTRHRPRSLTNAEIDGLVQELPQTMLPMFKFMLLTGIRLGEARELRWKDLDWEEDTCSITRSVSGVGKNLHVREGTKSASSTRIVPLAAMSVRILKQAKESQDRVGAHDLIFPSVSDPTKHYPESVFNQNLVAACNRLDIPRVSAHDLRHTWADRGGRNAESIKDVQDSLGHASPSMSLRYMKSSNEARRVLQAAVEDQFTVAIKGALS